jgi:two-component system, LuxR family, response regulator FixJ
MKKRVHVVDDDDAVRDSMKAILEAAGFDCDTHDSASAFLSAKATVDCALVDIRMPGMDGLALLEKLSARGTGTPIIIMTGFADVPLAVKAMRAGAVDFVEKPCPPGQIIDSVRRAVTQAPAKSIGDNARREASSRFEKLTQREREVLGLVVAGDANKVIAHKLGISARTVEIHRGRLMEKTQAQSLAELVRLAMLAGEP